MNPQQFVTDDLNNHYRFVNEIQTTPVFGPLDVETNGEITEVSMNGVLGIFLELNDTNGPILVESMVKNQNLQQALIGSIMDIIYEVFDKDGKLVASAAFIRNFVLTYSPVARENYLLLPVGQSFKLDEPISGGLRGYVTLRFSNSIGQLLKFAGTFVYEISILYSLENSNGSSRTYTNKHLYDKSRNKSIENIITDRSTDFFDEPYPGTTTENNLTTYFDDDNDDDDDDEEERDEDGTESIELGQDTETETLDRTMTRIRLVD